MSDLNGLTEQELKLTAALYARLCAVSDRR